MRPVEFVSDHLRLAGDLYLPEGADADIPAIVFCSGWAGEKYHRAATFAKSFNARGIAMLSFEYRGWGDSEGDRTRLFPHEHTTDALSAVAFLRQLSEIDSTRIAMMGLLNGAAVTLQAASEDPHIRAAVCMFPFGDGARWLRSLRRYWEWRAFQGRVEEHQVQLSATGTMELVSPFEIALFDPGAMERHQSTDDPAFVDTVWRLGLDSAAAIMAFRPEDHAHRIAPRPVLLVALDDDLMIPIDVAEALYDRLCEPKRFIRLPGIGHYEVYDPQWLSPLLEQIADFVLDTPPA